MTSPQIHNREERFRRYSRLLWKGFAGMIGLVILIFLVLSFSNLPTLTQLENPKSQLASEVYAADGSVLGRYYTENRVAVRYPDLNPYLVEALLATEDERYYRHAGIDWVGLSRAVGKLGRDGGGSTITQQLAKQMFTGVAADNFLERVIQKLKEWIIATRLEKAYTKEEIIAMYLNIFEYNNNAFGVEAAAETYFSKTQSQLNREEAAMLVGMLKSPTRYNPTRNPELARKRREVVLKQMQKAGKISAAEYDSLRQTALQINLKKQTHVDGLAPYFRMELRKEVRRILSDPSIRNPQGEPYDVNRDGLKIYTTIDPQMQALAEEAALEHMKTVQASYRKVWKDKDPWTYRDKVGTDEETTEVEMAYREKRLRDFIRDSDRYKSLYQRILAPVLAEIGSDYDDWAIEMTDVERIIEEKEKGGVIKRLKASNSIGETLEGRYREILEDATTYSRMKGAYDELRNAARKEFDTPVEMTVFAYNEAGQVDTTMSPLDSIKYMRSFLQIGSLAVDPHTGFVRAWVGGVDHKWFPFDHVTTRRQVGSTFKPFVYATAIAQQGISPCYRVADLPQTIRVGESGFTLLKDWSPQNAEGGFSGAYLTLMEALRKSKNTVSVYLMKQLGDTEPVRGLVHNMGIDSSERYRNGRHVVPKSPAISLGATDLSVMEMSGAYTTFANGGVYVKPILVQRIEDAMGKVLYQAMPEERTALDPVSNYVMVRMLQYAGRNYQFSGVETPYGGKTGTTNDYVDGWYMGITPDLIVGTWVGGDERWIRFLSITYGQGSYMARPFFAKLLKKIEENKEELDWDTSARFTVPAEANRVQFDCDAGVYASDEEFSGDGGGWTPDSTSGSGFGNDPFGGSDPFGGADPFGSGSSPFDGADPFGDELRNPPDTLDQ